MLTSYQIAEKHGMMSKGEVDLMKRCAEMLPEDAICVNIGAGYGTSVAALLETAPTAFVFSVDKSPRPEERELLSQCDVDVNRCVRLLGKSWDVGEYFPFQIDYLLIDGAHYKEAVEKDIAAWVPKLRGEGLLLFHDYDHPKAPVVGEVVDAFLQTLDTVRFIGKERYLLAVELG